MIDNIEDLLNEFEQKIKLEIDGCNDSVAHCGSYETAANFSGHADGLSRAFDLLKEILNSK